MKKINYLIFYWLPTFIWMAIIFYFSSRQSVSVSSDYYLNFIFFKFLHLSEYAILYFLIYRSIASLKNKFFNQANKYYYPILISILYAVSDEIHQLFTPTREGKIRDILIDIAGILIMYTVIKRYKSLFKKLNL